MIVGFTGTRKGMTDAQKSAFGQWIYGRAISIFHHGACRGADAESVRIIDDELHPRPIIIAHPSDLEAMTDPEAISLSGPRHWPKPPLVRNKDIVDECDTLLACPEGPEVIRSGTWSTIRYARKLGKTVVIFWPNGDVT